MSIAARWLNRHRLIDQMIARALVMAFERDAYKRNHQEG